MAKYERALTGDLDDLMNHVDSCVLRSASASLEDGSDVTNGDARMLVRVYERYSAMGGNRVSLNISAVAVGDQIYVSAISSGGSQAMFFKVNTIGEDTFLDIAAQALDDFAGRS